MGYHTIIVGTDGSATAAKAVRKAARFAKVVGGKLVVVCARVPDLVYDETAEEALAAARETAQQVRVPVETMSPSGDAGAVLVEVAESSAADLIVVGSVGMGKERRFRLGAVAERTAHHAPCDVLIVRTTGEEGPVRRRVYEGIVTGTDGSSTASEAVRRAFDLGMMLETKVTVVYVPGDPLVGAIVLERAMAAKTDWIPVETRLADEGPPAIRIAEIADAGAGELIVVGNKGVVGARRFLLSSVPVQLAHEAARDLLIAKTTDRSIDDLRPGQGGLVTVDGKKLAVYIDEKGRTYKLSPRCQHMGCTVDWNGADKSWDCPCHGSRYRFDGEVFHGPAKKSLDPA
ncbi:MAG TPA: universal stress protein [Actinomycetota bacterium]|nr:universal stress protein [Actinomycetota bacterium]